MISSKYVTYFLDLKAHCFSYPTGNAYSEMIKLAFLTWESRWRDHEKEKEIM